VVQPTNERNWSVLNEKQIKIAAITELQKKLKGTMEQIII